MRRRSCTLGIHCRRPRQPNNHIYNREAWENSRRWHGGAHELAPPRARAARRRAGVEARGRPRGSGEDGLGEGRRGEYEMLSKEILEIWKSKNWTNAEQTKLLLIRSWAIAIDPFLARAGPGPGPMPRPCAGPSEPFPPGRSIARATYLTQCYFTLCPIPPRASA